jgi:transposase
VEPERLPGPLLFWRASPYPQGRAYPKRKE